MELIEAVTLPKHARVVKSNAGVPYRYQYKVQLLFKCFLGVPGSLYGPAYHEGKIANFQEDVDTPVEFDPRIGSYFGSLT